MLDQRVEVTTLAAVATERLEAEVQTGAASLAAATCEWLLRIAELDRRQAWASWDCRSMAHWLSWKCALSIRTGREHVRVARDLERLPRVVAEFAAGRLSYSKVRALSRLVTEPELEAELVEMALVATASQLDTITAGCARVRRLNDPEREQLNHDERSLSVVLDDDGRGTVTLRGPVDLVAEFMVAVSAAVGDERANDGEGIAARQFDAALTIARRSIEPAADGGAPTTIVVRAEGSPTGDPDDAVRVTVHRMPISRAAYERLRCDAAIAVERFLDDGSIERTPTKDAIPRRVRRAVRNRDLGCCRWPGCDARASVHLHHIVWRSQFGPNTMQNLVSLCHYHHRSIHHRGWSVVGDANGALQFVDARGRIADEHTGRRAPIREGALARTQAANGFTPDESTIATAFGERMQRAWAIGVVCDREAVFQRRN